MSLLLLPNSPYSAFLQRRKRQRRSADSANSAQRHRQGWQPSARATGARQHAGRATRAFGSRRSAPADGSRPGPLRGRAARQQRHGRHLGQVMAVRTVTNRERAALAGEVQQSTDCMPAVHVPPGA